MNLTLIILMVTSYLFGSIPFALVIGKVFYGIDVRNYGSGNLGGTNTGRVLGGKAGLAVILLDVFKCFICVQIANIVGHYTPLPDTKIYLCAISCVIGHCFPIFANFKGGKAVAVMFGYALAINFWLCMLMLAILLIVLKITKYVSLSSIIASISLVIFGFFFDMGIVGFICNLFICLFVIYRHRNNLVKIKNGTESKITWM